MKGLQKTDNSEPRRKLPITADVLNDLATKVLARPWSSAHYQLLVMGFVAHAALLRGSELCALKMGNVTFSDDGVSCTLTIHKSKANKLGPPERVRLVDFAPMAVAALRTHMRKYAQQDPAAPLFARQTSKSTTISMRVGLMKRCVDSLKPRGQASSP